MAHKNNQILEQELKTAEGKVKVGEMYFHYKNPEKKYRVIGFGVQETSDKICVLYKAMSNDKLIFVRDLDSWLKKPIIKGKKVLRFTQVNE